jgi:hypothetical protein
VDGLGCLGAERQVACAICYCVSCWLDPFLGGGSAAFAIAGGFFGWLSDRYGGPDAPEAQSVATRARSGVHYYYVYPSLGSAFGNFEKAFGPKDPGYFDQFGEYQRGTGRTTYFSDGLNEFMNHWAGDVRHFTTGNAPAGRM